MKRFSGKQIAGFLIPSAIGILLFMVPIYVGGQFGIVDGFLTFVPSATPVWAIIRVVGAVFV